MVVLYNAKNEPVVPFQRVLDRCDQGLYSALEDLDKDVQDLFKGLQKRGQRVDRVLKHYEYLKGYYFPGYGVTGTSRRASRR